MRVNDFFEAVFVINLLRRLDRLVSITEELKKYGIVGEVFQAVDGNDLPFPENLSQDGSFPSRGDIGCTLSHLKVCKIAKERSLKNYLLLEDDAKFSQDFLAQFEYYSKQVPEDWSLLYLGGSYNGTVERVSFNINRATKIFTTHAMGVNANIYDALIEGWEKQNEKVDLCVSALQEKYPTYAFNPFIVGQRPSYSDILYKDTDYKHLQV